MTSTIKVGDQEYTIYPFDRLPQEKITRLPYALKILLENLLRHEHLIHVDASDIDALVNFGTVMLRLIRK